MMSWGIRVGRAIAVVAFVSAPLMLLSQPSVQAAQIDVTDAGDTGPGTLRAAITAAAAAGTDDVIVVQPGLGTINLASVISWVQNGALTIQGNGVTINGNGSDGVLYETGGTGALSIDGVTITGSNATTGDMLGAVVAQATGNLSLSNCVVTGNHATGSVAGSDIGAIVLIGAGTFSLTNCAVTNNVNAGTTNLDIGGALDIEGGAATVTNSNISGNSATAASVSVVAGAIDSEGGPLTIINTSITGNSATLTSGTGDVGGAITSEGGVLTITNSTISGNSASAPAGTPPGNNTTGGVLVFGGAVSTVYVTLTNNVGGQGANFFTEFVWSPFATVVSGGTPNCFFDVRVPAPTSQGYNFSDDSSCGLLAGTDKQSAGSPGLGALAGNGGPGPTQLPGTGSPLIDAIPNASCQADGAAGVTTDERGVTRPQFGGCDIGAVEVSVPVPVVIPPAFTG